MPLFQEEEEEEEEKEKEKKNKRKGKGKSTGKPNRSTTWKKEEINNPPLCSYNHEAPSYVENPQQYFHKFFSFHLIKHI